MLKWNAVKVVCGFVAGTPLLYAMRGWEPWLISLVQLLFFSLFYAALDKVRACWVPPSTPIRGRIEWAYLARCLREREEQVREQIAEEQAQAWEKSLEWFPQPKMDWWEGA